MAGLLGILTRWADGELATILIGDGTLAGAGTMVGEHRCMAATGTDGTDLIMDGVVDGIHLTMLVVIGMATTMDIGTDTTTATGMVTMMVLGMEMVTDETIHVQ